MACTIRIPVELPLYTVKAIQNGDYDKAQLVQAVKDAVCNLGVNFTYNAPGVSEAAGPLPTNSYAHGNTPSQTLVDDEVSDTTEAVLTPAGTISTCEAPRAKHINSTSSWLSRAKRSSVSLNPTSYSVTGKHALEKPSRIWINWDNPGTIGVHHRQPAEVLGSWKVSALACSIAKATQIPLAELRLTHGSLTPLNFDRTISDYEFSAPGIGVKRLKGLCLEGSTLDTYVQVNGHGQIELHVRYDTKVTRLAFLLCQHYKLAAGKWEICGAGYPFVWYYDGVNIYLNDSCHERMTLGSLNLIGVGYTCQLVVPDEQLESLGLDVDTLVEYPIPEDWRLAKTA